MTLYIIIHLINCGIIQLNPIKIFIQDNIYQPPKNHHNCLFSAAASHETVRHTNVYQQPNSKTNKQNDKGKKERTNTQNKTHIHWIVSPVKKNAVYTIQQLEVGSQANTNWWEKNLSWKALALPFKRSL